MDSELSFQSAREIVPAQQQINISASDHGVAIGEVHDGLHVHVESPAVMSYLLERLGITPLVADEKISSQEWGALRRDCFNVFVLENENYKNMTFAIPRSCALERYTNSVYQQKFRSLPPAATAIIENMPCIFATRNERFRWTAEDHPAVLGKVTQIVRQRENVVFSFKVYDFIKQNEINANIAVFGLVQSALRNELDEEHWSIRSGSLQSAVAKVNTR